MSTADFRGKNMPVLFKVLHVHYRYFGSLIKPTPLQFLLAQKNATHLFSGMYRLIYLTIMSPKTLKFFVSLDKSNIANAIFIQEDRNMYYWTLPFSLIHGKVVSHMYFVFYSVYLIPLVQCKIWVLIGQKTYCQKSQLFLRKLCHFILVILKITVTLFRITLL